MKTRIKGYVDTECLTYDEAKTKAIKVANSFKSAPKSGIEDVVTKVYFTALNIGKILVAVNAKDRTILHDSSMKLVK